MRFVTRYPARASAAVSVAKATPSQARRTALLGSFPTIDRHVASARRASSISALAFVELLSTASSSWRSAIPLSSSAEPISDGHLATGDVDHWFPQNLSPEGVATPTPLAHLRLCLCHDVYVAADGALNRTKLLRQGYAVRPPDDQKIYVASGGIRPRRMRSENVRRVDTG